MVAYPGWHPITAEACVSGLTGPSAHPSLTLINFRIDVGEDCEAICSKTALKVHLRRPKSSCLSSSTISASHLFLGPHSPLQSRFNPNPPSTSLMCCHLLSPSHSLVIQLTSMSPVLPHLPHQSPVPLHPKAPSLVPSSPGAWPFSFHSPLSQ